jgi:hypothetical protein
MSIIQYIKNRTEAAEVRAGKYISELNFGKTARRAYSHPGSSFSADYSVIFHFVVIVRPPTVARVRARSHCCF